MEDKRIKIVLAGGGTLGSISPLLAIARQYPANYLFIKSKYGPEEDFIASYNINAVSIASGKLRRYFSWQNFFDFFKIKWAFWQSVRILLKFKPDVILTAGSFVAVPVVWAGWLLKIPAIVHQQDIEVGLANKLMAPFVKRITVSFPILKNNFKKDKTVVTGNPVRSLDKKIEGKPIVVITGGGLGSRGLNQFIAPLVPLLTKQYEVHHILGNSNIDQKLNLQNYYPYQRIVGGMIELLAKADIIISRAGMSLITEVANLRKSLVLVPLPDSHQEKNAAFFAKNNAALIVKEGSRQIMERYLEKLMENNNLREVLADNLYNLFPKNAVKKYIKVINEVVNKK